MVVVIVKVDHAALLSGWDLGVVIAALDVLTKSMRSQSGVAAGPAFELLDRLRAVHASSCAPQLTQVAPVADSSEWVSVDLITVKGAAEIMGTSESNIRARCKRHSLPSVVMGGRIMLPRPAVEQAAAVRGVA